MDKKFSRVRPLKAVHLSCVLEDGKGLNRELAKLEISLTNPQYFQSERRFCGYKEEDATQTRLHECEMDTTGGRC